MDKDVKKEEDLMIRALAIPPEKRAAFVQSESGRSQRLAESVTKLLRAHEKAGRFLETLPNSSSQEVVQQLQRIAPSEERPGDQIGRYRLLELLGVGNWGTVWVAQQIEDIDRRVALKILKLGMDSKEFLARFEAERQMQTIMDHPNIARVLDAGATEYGRPYLVMELVKGIPLLEFADKNRMSIAERVKLFIKICDAIQHAHEKGVVHRDLKPSNILVSTHNGEAFPKVIDFGVAKSNQGRVTDDIVFTGLHTFIGTPAYCSPEQLEFTGKEVDARSDLYSLGALLYQILCGATPFEYHKDSDEGMVAFCRRVREMDLPLPSQRYRSTTEEERAAVAAKRSSTPRKLASILKGELDWIADKCLEKNPDHRYDSVRSLARDLQAYLDGEPVSAHANSVYRIVKFVTRKHPAYAIWVEASVVMLAILASVFYFWPGSNSGTTADQKSIAVLPLENLSPDQENAFFADGVQEDILNNLSRIDEFLVIGRRSTLLYRNTTKTLEQIGDELDVRYFVEGSVRRDKGRVVISARLNDTKINEYIWSERYDRVLDETFAIQAEVARDIASQLQAALSPAEISQIEYRPTKNQLAYDYFMKARGEVYYRIDERISFYERAVELDPNFAEAWAKLADQRIVKWNRGNRQDNGLYVSAYESLEQAKRTGPGLADISFALSMFAFREQYDTQAAIDYLVEALSIDPNIYEGDIALGIRYAVLGRLAEAQHQYERAVRVDPLSFGVNYHLLTTYAYQKMWDKAIALIEKNGANSTVGPWSRILAYTQYLQTGDKEAYIKAIESLPEYSEEPYLQLQRSLLVRDYPNALLHFGNLDPKWSQRFPNFGGLNLFGGWSNVGGINMEPTKLPAALIRFMQGDKDNWLTNAENARTTFEERISVNPMAEPINWSHLSICYALEGNFSRMESAAAEAREKTQHPYYKYGFQAEVEIGIAIAYIVLGDYTKAIETLEAASKMNGPVFLERELDRWFIFDRLKGNPRFDALREG